MHRFLAARRESIAAFWLIVLVCLVRTAGAQTTWNDPRSRSLVEGATQRRLEQLADTGLKDYRATAHGYVTFLAQLGEGLRTPPKVIKADELELEVYWRAPNLSKQRIVGRRDTLLLPTDIAYHADHLGIVQNNFPNTIRIGEGDEVADVPHPLSPVGLREYDFALADSFAIGAGAQRIRVYEVKVRPKDDKQPRVVGAVYIERDGGQVVRMNFSFTRSALLDKALEELDVVLENRLVGGRFWLPSEQKIAIVRRGEYLDFPARGIINGRWEIGDYQLNQNVSPMLFTGPEIVAAPLEIRQHVWKGRLLDSMPADARAINEPDIARVQEEARELIRARALATTRTASLSARNISDFARFDRVEGLAAGGGVTQPFGAGFGTTVRARYGIDDKEVKGEASIGFTRPSGAGVRAFAMRDFRELGDVAERSMVVNSLAAQEFGSDYTDPYLARSVGLAADLVPLFDFQPRLAVSYGIESPLEVHATPVVNAFEPTVQFDERHVSRITVDLARPLSPWFGGTDFGMRIGFRARFPLEAYPAEGPGLTTSNHDTFRGSIVANIERPLADLRLATATTIAGVNHVVDQGNDFLPEAVYLGGPVSAPGYAYHSLVSFFGFTEHAELQMPAPFVSFSLGRYGRVPSQATFAPYAHYAYIADPAVRCVVTTAGGPPIAIPTSSRAGCDLRSDHQFPSLGAAYILPFNLIRFDVARGLGPAGRWTFNVDVSRDLWGIL
ncbi:MAG TPA: hypothetical protein VH277_03385 [Gemmatimonadaceae bacterium]|jgi:hypothetical protein|nr:hypothetical protein [Gemmatimonadaceae bacterium]